LENDLIGLFEVVNSEGRWQFLYKLGLLLNIEQFAYVGVLLNVVVYFPRQRLRNFILIRQLLKYLQVLALFYVL
jgi:hypothetical protein